jgi:hypothetical protein
MTLEIYYLEEYIITLLLQGFKMAAFHIDKSLQPGMTSVS